MYPSLIAVLWLTLAGPPQRDSDCLACHAQPGLKGKSGQSLTVNEEKRKSGVHGALGCTTCHAGVSRYPHPKKIPKVECGTCHAEPAELVPKSVHGMLGEESCTGCHGPPHEIQPAARVIPDQCGSCHAQAAKEYALSIHATFHRTAGNEGAICSSCHGPPHRIRPASDPASPVAKQNLPDTCGSCHANPEFLARHNIPFARPVEAYRLSVHGRAIARGNLAAASCSDCHNNHAIFPAQDPRSKINHWNIPETCGACHSEIKQTYEASVHGQAVRAGAADAPVCTDCHGEHNILAPGEPLSLVNPARVSSATCGRCHADERLAARYNLPLDRVPTFQDSYHGLALREGSQTVANCASCHGVHNIFPSSDPRSTVNPANLAKTCGKCHAGAGQRFAIGRVHVFPAAEHPVVRWIRAFYLLVIPFAVGFMVLHNVLDFVAKLVRCGPRVDSKEELPRMNLHFRIAHGLVMASFPALVVTGFALKFPDAWWAAPLLHWESKFAFRGLLHRIAAVVLLCALAYHVVHLLASRRDRVIVLRLWLRVQDGKDLAGTMAYNLGLKKQRPALGVFSYAEKIEYWAFVWGTGVMALSGFLLWFINLTLRYFPKWVADAATVVHYYEAILATLSILVWHFYMVIFDPEIYPMELSWLTGKVSADLLRRTRPGYYAELAARRKLSEGGSDNPASGSALSPPPAPARQDSPLSPPSKPSAQPDEKGEKAE